MADGQDVDDFLKHYGVLGMKWGVTRSEKALSAASAKRDTSSPKKRFGISDDKEIKRARKSLVTKRKAYSAQEDKFATTKDKAQKLIEKNKLKVLDNDYSYDKDRATAVKRTNGEKLASIVLAGPAGLSNVAMWAVVSNRIKENQRTKKYK